MKPVDILEWSMGWAWPIMTALVALMAWGIARFLNWGEQEPIWGTIIRSDPGQALCLSVRLAMKIS
jgi:hypothetical protein